MAESTLSASRIETFRQAASYGSEPEFTADLELICDAALSAITLRTTLAAEIERREMAEKAREDCYQANLLIRAQQKEDYARAETAERALADAQECIEQKDASLLRGADAMTKDAEFIRSLKAELAKLRAPVDLPKIIKDFDAFLNEPPQYENKRMVRDYRHAAYQKWQPVVECGLLLAAQVRERDGRIALLERAIVDHSEYETEYDGSMISLCIQCGNNLDMQSHRPDCIAAALTQPTGRKEQS